MRTLSELSSPGESRPLTRRRKKRRWRWVLLIPLLGAQEFSRPPAVHAQACPRGDPALPETGPSSPFAPHIPPPLDASPNDVAERTVRALVRHGFANVAVVENGRCVFATFENTRYRDQRRALREAAGLAISESRDGRALVLVPTSRGVPLVTIRYPGLGHDRVEALGEQLPSPTPAYVSLDVTGLPPSLSEATRASSSFGRIDVVVHPWLETQFGNFDNPVASRAGLAPELRVALRPGLGVSAQALVTFQDDLPSGESRFRPGLVTLNQTVRLPHDVFVSATLGAFSSDRYGVDLEAGVYFLSGRLSAAAALGLTGAVSYAQEGWWRTPMRDRTALVDIAWREPQYDLLLRATAGTFLADEQGVRLDVLRQFGELEVGWFVVGSEQGANGGVTLRIPLPVTKAAAPGPLRLRMADSYRWQYHYRSQAPRGRRYYTGSSLEELRRRLEADYMRDGLVKSAREHTGLREGSVPALTGTTGLVTIPVAEMPRDGTVTVGASLLDGRYQAHGVAGYAGNSAMVQFASVGFLPFAEVGLRLTRATGVPRQALGDRMVSVRLRVLKEGAQTPAVVIGAQDVVGTRIFHAVYVVGSRDVRSIPLLGRVGLHLGYGGRLSLPAVSHQFQGVFGGVSVTPRPWVSLLAEHDAARVNAALRLRLGPLTLTGAALGLDAFSGGVSYTHRLN